ncbi:phosphatase PAP2 family protein [Hymenobacter sp. BT175]|uniref:phosphatase PAP2 family protein n=1 Tax=Hymenobacter translucens TaxID=2886507 RepID=UPI001D0E9F79|nr:phosphatase PAP2 family protein [Hymenobacter translucens]MCC2548132.1 phosphatase PAP2 family protein [Hymenobacter translucens]
MKRLLRLLELLTAEVIVLLALFVLAFTTFFWLTRVVFVQHSDALDLAAFQLLDDLRARVPGLTRVVLGITFFGSAPYFVVVGILLPGLMVWQKRRREALEVFLALTGAAILNALLKSHFHRLRPGTALIKQLGMSFPSGHAMLGMALYGCLAWLLWRHGRHPVWAALLVVFALLIGLTRIYLHVHYATDVLAGFAAGLLWLILLRVALRFWWRRKDQV